jgi:hypothetical protein
MGPGAGSSPTGQSRFLHRRLAGVHHVLLIKIEKCLATIGVDTCSGTRPHAFPILTPMKNRPPTPPERASTSADHIAVDNASTDGEMTEVESEAFAESIREAVARAFAKFSPETSETAEVFGGKSIVVGNSDISGDVWDF